MGNCYSKKYNRIFVQEEDNSCDNIGSYDPDLYDIVKYIRNNCILSEDQIKYIKNSSKKDIKKIEFFDILSNNVEFIEITIY